MTFTTAEKNIRFEILKQEEKVISEMNDNSELIKRLQDIKKSHNLTYSVEDESTNEAPLKIALSENDNSL